MLFTPEDRRRIKRILLRKQSSSKEELEALVDSLLNLAMALNKPCIRCGGNGPKQPFAQEK